MNSTRKVVDYRERHDISEEKNYINKKLIKRLATIFTKSELIIFGIIYIMISCTISLSITLIIENPVELSSKIVQFITPFFAITIGFSITTVIFILNNIDNFSSVNKQTLFDIITLIISYVLISVTTIICFLFVIICGLMFDFSEKINDLFNFIIFFAILLDILVCFHLFIIIIHTLYILSSALIEKKTIHNENQE